MLVVGYVVLKLTNTFREFISSWVYLVLLLICPVASDWRVKMCTLDNGKGLLENALVGNFLDLPLLLVSFCTRCINELRLLISLLGSSAINYPARAT